MEAVASVTQKRQTPETGIVLGSGKLEEAAAAAAELGAECAVFDGELTGSQIRNISTALGGMEVIDRTMLILEIFRSRAVTNEGKLQTELALLRYRLPRLQGMGESLSRQGGGGGGGGGARRGAGETKLELDRRHVHARIDALAEKLAEMEKRRGESRKARAKTGMPVVSLVGYTNVGKSSLMNALCGPSVAEADMLFATLDPTSRKLVLPSGMAVLLVDTVGFVSRLPHNLVEAFKSTLEEAAWSDVIVRVADAGDDQREEQLAITDEVLDGLDCADIPRLTVYNKCDKPNALNFDPDILLTSAKTGYGLDALLKKLDELLSDRVHTIRVRSDVFRQFRHIADSYDHDNCAGDTGHQQQCGPFAGNGGRAVHSKVQDGGERPDGYRLSVLEHRGRYRAGCRAPAAGGGRQHIHRYRTPDIFSEEDFRQALYPGDPLCGQRQRRRSLKLVEEMAGRCR